MLSPQRPEQSIRSSCDRCRSSKLKCVSSSSQDPSAPCQRCIRAKATCVFGQRARNKRGPRRPRQSASPAPEEWPREISSDEAPPSLTSSSTTPCSPTDTRKPRREAPALSEPVILTPPSLISNIDTDWKPTSDMMALHSSAANIDEWREECWAINDCTMADASNNMWADNGIPLTNDGLLHDFPISHTPITSFNFDRHESIEFNEVALQSIDRGVNRKHDPTSGRSASFQLELSALLGEMQKYLHLLKVYYASDNRYPEDALNNYPIGEALYLIQRFCELQKRIGAAGHSPTWPQSAIDPDMVASLVIVTCYITMTRILQTLFGHLEQYLTRMGPESMTRVRKSVTEHCRGLRLGELTPANDVCAQTREAVSALLNALRGMDSAIGTPHEQQQQQQQQQAWVGDEMDDVADSIAKAVSFERSGLTVNLLREENISIRVDEERKMLHRNIAEVEQHLDRLLNPSVDGPMAMA